MTDWSAEPASPSRQSPAQLASQIQPQAQVPQQAIYTSHVPTAGPSTGPGWTPGQYGAPYPSFPYYPAVQPSQAHVPYPAGPHHLPLPPISTNLQRTPSDNSSSSRPSPQSAIGAKRSLGADEEANGKKQRSTSSDTAPPESIHPLGKREKGPKNCRECRRTKSKCDRIFPCSNCRKKGCAVACPDGDLSNMTGKRLVLASTQQLHERMALLEAALFQAHSLTSSEQHPLLTQAFLDIGGKPPHQDSNIKVDDILLENPSRTWASENASPALRRESSNNIDQMTDRLRAQSLEDRKKALKRLPELMRALPPREETARRAKLFWSRSGWFPNILRQIEFENIYEPAVYAPTPENPVSPHKLACVFITLAFSAFLDLDNHESDDPVIGEFFDNAQACFESRFFGFGVSVPGVQALGLMALFVQFGWPGGGNWSLLRQMTSAVQQLGLHREPTNPRLSQRELDLRRRVFHEAFMLDCILSLTAGQRIALVPEEIDAQYPSDATAEDEMKYSYMRDNYSRILQLALRPELHPAPQSMLNPIEDVLMQYDKKACPALHCIGWVTGLIPEEVEDKTRMDVPDLNLCANTMSHYKALGFLHRPMLRRIIARVRPLLDNGGFELSEYEKHVIRGSYEAAEAISVTSSYLYKTHPKLCQRLWFVWVQAFSALVTITAIATFIPGSYPAAHIELTRMVGYFSAAGPKSQAAELLPLVQQLRVILARRHPNMVNRYREQLREIPGYPDLEGEDMLFALLGGSAPPREAEAPPDFTPPSLPADIQTFSQVPLHFEPPAYTDHPASVLQAMPAAAWLERAQYFYEPTPYRADGPAPTWNMAYSSYV